jgi:hypothetical protein
LVSRANALTTGFFGSILSQKKGDPAFDLKADTETLLANAGFDALLELKDSGGTLGQIAVAELQALQAAQQNLLTSQSQEQYVRNLNSFVEQRRQTASRLRSALEREKALYGGTFEDYKNTVGGGMTSFIESRPTGDTSLDDIDAQIRALEAELSNVP